MATTSMPMGWWCTPPRRPPAGQGQSGRGTAGAAHVAGHCRHRLEQRDGWNPDNPLVQALVRETARTTAALRARASRAMKRCRRCSATTAFMTALKPGQDPLQAGFHGHGPRHGAMRCLGGQPRLCCRSVRPRAAGAPPAGLHLQALCVRRCLHAGACSRLTQLRGRGRRDPRWRGGEVWRPTDAGAPSGRSHDAAPTRWRIPRTPSPPR